MGRTDAEDIAEAAAMARGTTMEERTRILEALCRMAAELVSQHFDPGRTLAWQDPLSPETEALLAR